MALISAYVSVHSGGEISDNMLGDSHVGESNQRTAATPLTEGNHIVIKVSDIDIDSTKGMHNYRPCITYLFIQKEKQSLCVKLIKTQRLRIDLSILLIFHAIGKIFVSFLLPSENQTSIAIPISLCTTVQSYNLFVVIRHGTNIVSFTSHLCSFVFLYFSLYMY